MRPVLARGQEPRGGVWRRGDHRGAGGAARQLHDQNNQVRCPLITYFAKSECADRGSSHKKLY